MILRRGKELFKFCKSGCWSSPIGQFPVAPLGGALAVHTKSGPGKAHKKTVRPGNRPNGFDRNYANPTSERVLLVASIIRRFVTTLHSRRGADRFGWTDFFAVLSVEVQTNDFVFVILDSSHDDRVHAFKSTTQQFFAQRILDPLLDRSTQGACPVIEV